MITKILRTEKEIMADWKVEYSIPLLSISCLVYNHEKYIEDTLEGFLIQKTDFPFEIVIHDDASTDNTANIIREYEALYPNIIKPIYQNENQFSKGINNTATYNFPRIRGKYVAICEGDDYWIDPLKLQLSVDFLEKNDGYIGCCHDVEVINENLEIETITPYGNYKGDLLSIGCQLKYNNIPTLSLVFKNVWKDKLGLIHKKLSYNCGFVGDYQLKCLLLSEGSIKYFKKKMAVYRWHRRGGLSFSSEKGYSKSLMLNEVYKNILEYLSDNMNPEELKILRKLQAKCYVSFLYHCSVKFRISELIIGLKYVYNEKLLTKFVFCFYKKVVNKLFSRLKSITC